MEHPLRKNAMRRFLVPTLGLCLLAGAGCAHQHRLTPAQQAMAERRAIARAIAEDHRRLLGEAAPKPPAVTGITHAFSNFGESLWAIPRRIYDRFAGNTPA